jgi:beta-lactamase class A
MFSLLLSIPGHAQRRSFSGSNPKATSASALADLVNRAAQTALAKFASQKLTESQLSITLIDLRDPQHPVTASFRGNERVYPASVVKLFYLGAVHRWLEDKKIQETDEL